MKKVILLSLLIFGSYVATSQVKYDKLWAEVEKLELEGKYKSASEVVDKILKKAERSNNSKHIVKGFIYKSKFALEVDEAVQSKIILDLESAIEKFDFPTNALLNSVYAGYLEQYLQGNRYRVRKRTPVVSSEGYSNFLTWDINTFVHQIDLLYRASIKEEEKLKKLSIKDFEILVTKSKTSKKFRPTLYDFLVHRAIDFHATNRWYVKRPKERFYINNSVVFSPTSAFVKEPFFTIDSVLSNRNVLKLYQKLELFHENTNTTAYVDIILNRLNFVKSHATIQQKDSLYLSALKNLALKFKKHESSAFINYHIANYYFQKSNKTNAKKDPILKNYRIKAMAICEQVLSEFPNSDGGLLSKVLKNKIKEQSITIQTEKYIVPEKPFLARVKFKSIDSLYLSIYKITHHKFQNLFSTQRDSALVELVKEKKADSVRFYQLQPQKNYYQYTTEIDLPKQTLGKYVLVASTKRNIQKLEDLYSYSLITVTNLSLIDIDNDESKILKVLNRDNGSLIKKAKISVTGEDFYQKGVTNRDGEYLIKKQEKSYSKLNINVSHKGDTIHYNGYYLYRYYKSSKEINEERGVKMHLYLDRSIYRPGQTVFFKGIMVETKGDNSKVVPNTHVTILISDANGTELKELRLKTNEFGSVSGEYKLPRNILTGEFSIEMDEDYGTDEEDEDAYYDDIIDVQMAEEEFSVEEYKRPKFEIEFEPIKENQVLGDSVHVNGNAKALLGSAITDAKVSYTITRSIVPNWRVSSFRSISDQVIKTGTIKTDDKGKFQIDFIATPDSLALKENKPVFNYDVQVDVTDINGETRSNSTNVLVGYHNIKLSLIASPKIDKSVIQQLTIDTENLNNQHVDADVEIDIYKLSSPDRVLRKKPWKMAELPILSKDEFIKLFPNEAYDDTDLKKYWKKGALVFSKKFKNKEDTAISLKNIEQWRSGAYAAIIKATDTFGDVVSLERNFEVFDPKEKEFSDHKLFEHQIVNSKYKEDKHVLLLLKTAAKHLQVNIEAYYENESIFKEIVSIEGGHKYIKVPVKKSYRGQLHINAYFTKFNSIVSKRFSVTFPEQEKRLNIETLSFRNKLIPNQKETWSFKITGPDQRPVEAEILASMYDTSLDQFKSHNWDMGIGMKGYDISYAPWIDEKGFFGTTNFRMIKRFGGYNDMTSFIRNYHQLQWFGFHFGTPNYKNKIYLSNLKNRLQSKTYPPGKITGIVADRDGPLPGVSVLIRGTKTGTETDFDGYYSLNAPMGSEIIFNYLGYKSDSIIIGKAGTYNILMEEGGAILDEIVVTAQGIMKQKKGLSASVSYVNAVMISEDIERKLAGKAAGVQIVDAAGAESKIIIRGASSISETSTPLYVVDGIPLSLKDGITLGSGDIADISVLKGASATTLYGSKGANGVVIITTKKGLEELTQVEARTNLKETAFFYPHVKTNKKGEISFGFDSPQALTKWRLMLLAHSKSLETGVLEKFAVTQKDINVIPNAPRFLREKDTVVISAKIANLTTEQKSGSALLQLFDAFTMEPISMDQKLFKKVKVFNIGSKQSASVEWKLSIPEGLQALQYKIVAKSGNHSDGEQAILPVLSNRILVTESKVLWVQPGTIEKVTFDKFQKPVSKTQKNHKLTLEYTSNPAWLAIQSLPYLIEFPHECAEQTFSRFYANRLAGHILEKNPKIEEVFKSWKKNGQLNSSFEENEELKSIFLEESPWIKDLKSDADQKTQLAMLFDKERVKEKQSLAISKLIELQLPSGGFPWFAGGRENVFITRHIVAGFGHLDKLNTKTSIDYEIKRTLEKAIKYLDQEFISRYNRLMSYQKNSEKPVLDSRALHYLYARSFYLESHQISEKLEEVITAYLEEGKNSWLELPLYSKGLLALSAHRFKKVELAKKIMESLDEQAVISKANGMYWKENGRGWYWYQSPVETQTLMIETFAEIKKDRKKVDQLKLWLLKRKQTNRWSTTKATTEAIYAMLSFGTDWLSVSDNTVIKIGDQKIKTKKLSTVKKEAGTGYMKLNWTQNEMTPKMATITVQNKSKVVGSGGVYWQYFEDLDKITSSDSSPLQIRKSMYVKQRNDSGESFQAITDSTSIKIGDLIRVRIEIASKNDMEFVHLKDLRASGLEPIDVLSKYKWQDGLGYYQSTKDVATHFFFDRLPKGTYVFEYDLRANNHGNFSNGISTIQSMYAPEFSSHTTGKRLRID